MPNNLELILAAARLIEAAGDCIKNEQPLSSDLIEALAEMQFQLGRCCGSLLNSYWWNELNRLTLEKIKLHKEEKVIKHENHRRGRTKEKA